MSIYINTNEEKWDAPSISSPSLDKYRQALTTTTTTTNPIRRLFCPTTFSFFFFSPQKRERERGIHDWRLTRVRRRPSSWSFAFCPPPRRKKRNCCRCHCSTQTILSFTFFLLLLLPLFSFIIIPLSWVLLVFGSGKPTESSPSIGWCWRSWLNGMKSYDGVSPCSSLPAWALR